MIRTFLIWYTFLGLLWDVTPHVLSLNGVSPSCGKRPVIEHTFTDKLTSPPFPEGAFINYVCLHEYRPEGNSLFTCDSGKWIGGPFSCIIKKCPELPLLQHGTMRGNTNNYAVGTVIRFACDTGYKLVGSKAILCLKDANWNSRNLTECRRITCPPEPSVEHGTITVEHAVDGEDSVYGAIRHVNCDPGYIRSGKRRVSCTANGQWTKLPQCKPVNCPDYPGLNAKCVTKTKLEFENTLLFLYCTDNSIFIYQEKETASCFNNTWDNLSLGCFCNCKVKPKTELVHLENVDSYGFLKHNEILNWTCTNGSTKITSEQLVCIDGLIGTPNCVKSIHNTIETLAFIGALLIVAFSIIAIIGFCLFKKVCKGKITCGKDTKTCNNVEDCVEDGNVSSDQDNADGDSQTEEQNAEIHHDRINYKVSNEENVLLPPLTLKNELARSKKTDDPLSEITKSTSEPTSSTSDNSKCIDTEEQVGERLRKQMASRHVSSILRKKMPSQTEM